MPAEPDLPPKDLLPKTGWKASAETAKALDGNPATFTMLFYHDPYKGSSDKSILEYYYDASLKNPYLTPVVRFRRGLHGQDYLYVRPGVRKPLEFNWLPEGLTVTPAFYVDFGNERMHMLRYGKRRPDGSSWGNGAMAVLCNAVFKHQV